MKEKIREVLAPPSIFIVPHGGYPFDVMVCIGASDAEVIAALRDRRIEPTAEELKGLDMGQTVEGCAVILSGNGTVLRLKNFNGSPKCLGRLAHEVFHACDMMLYRIGMRPSDDSCEAYAYAIQHLMTEITTALESPPSRRERGILPALRSVKTARRAATVKRSAVAKAARAASKGRV